MHFKYYFIVSIIFCRKLKQENRARNSIWPQLQKQIIIKPFGGWPYRREKGHIWNACRASPLTGGWTPPTTPVLVTNQAAPPELSELFICFHFIQTKQPRRQCVFEIANLCFWFALFLVSERKQTTRAMRLANRPNCRPISVRECALCA